ncbi:hypothetical protein [Chryseobacterium oryzae]|uniref:Uncharacterized protein n=1 Tax=Chryseobacterium oryzae TaxID=2929799 RepID=A0ABY4BF41_9FLAO|nr:hypothetical protein [Chryseobacterium oryzae]UOE37773.1 hypothetical protein MTP08_12010 [Chryseobacterium oryzae]
MLGIVVNSSNYICIYIFLSLQKYKCLDKNYPFSNLVLVTAIIIFSFLGNNIVAQKTIAGNVSRKYLDSNSKSVDSSAVIFVGLNTYISNSEQFTNAIIVKHSKALQIAKKKNSFRKNVLIAKNKAFEKIIAKTVKNVKSNFSNRINQGNNSNFIYSISLGQNIANIPIYSFKVFKDFKCASRDLYISFFLSELTAGNIYKGNILLIINDVLSYSLFSRPPPYNYFSQT